MSTNLNSERQVKDAVGRVRVAVGLLDLLDEQAEGVVQFVRSELQNVGLERLNVAALSPSLLQLGVLPDDPMLPRVDTVRELKIKNKNLKRIKLWPCMLLTRSMYSKCVKS